MNQPDLFTAHELRDFGITAAERDRTLVIQAVDKAVHVCAGMSLGFTAEDVRALLGRYVADLEAVSKVIGGRIRSAAKSGEIYTNYETVVGKRPESHARRMLVWYGKDAA
jgi:Fe-S cluster assembly ATPase SufC